MSKKQDYSLADANARAGILVAEVEEKNKKLQDLIDKITTQQEALAEANAHAAMLMAELEEANDKINKQNEYIENIFAGMLDTLIIVDKEGKIQGLNNAACRLLQFSEEELVKKHISSILADTEFPDKSSKILEVLSFQSTVQNLEIIYKTKSGNKIPMLMSCSTFQHSKNNKHSEHMGILCAATDISERKKAEERLRNALNELQESEQKLCDLNIELEEKNSSLKKMDNLKSQFVSNVSHEFKNPLFVISESISIVLDLFEKDLANKQIKLLTNAKRSSDRLLRLVIDLLDLSKIEAGKLCLMKKGVDLKELSRQILNFYELPIKNKKISLIENISEKIPQIQADPDKLEQAIINVFNNAIKFTPENGTIEYNVFQRQNHIQIEIVDNGPGINEEEADKIFDKFERITKEKVEGTGLGLPISRDIIKLHGGKIWIDCNNNKGSKFIIELPI